MARWIRILGLTVFLLGGWGSAQAAEQFIAAAEVEADDASWSWVGAHDGTTGWESLPRGVEAIPTWELVTFTGKGPGPTSSDSLARIILWDENHPQNAMGSQTWNQGSPVGGTQLNVVIAGGK